MFSWALWQDAFTVFMGILIEATPFVLLGVLLSSLLHQFVKAETLVKLIPKNRFLAILTACSLGFLFPVCECGNVPVARGLIRKGVEPYIAIAFLLSAPVFNPVVIFATYAAFKAQPEIIYGRLGLTFIVVFVTAWLFSLVKNPQAMLQSRVFEKASQVPLGKPVAAGLAMASGGGTFQIRRGKNEATQGQLYSLEQNKNDNPWFTFFDRTVHEFFEMGGTLVIGAFLASVIQVQVPREVLLSVGSDPVLSILAMLSLAVLVSICSTVDSFFALSYSSTFSGGAILAFLVFGPLIDIKGVVQLLTTFSAKTVTWLSLTTGLLAFSLCLAYNFYGGL